MKEVRTQKRYQCGFCKRRSNKPSMEKHEIICYKNPNRYCETCKNTGEITDDINGDGSLVSREPCPYCPKVELSF